VTVPAINPTDWAKAGAEPHMVIATINAELRHHVNLISHLPSKP
jgi:hypothetical protein